MDGPWLDKAEGRRLSADILLEVATPQMTMLSVLMPVYNEAQTLKCTKPPRNYGSSMRHVS